MTNHGEFPIAEFGFPGPLRDRLIAAILAGTKTSTSSTFVEYSVEDEQLPIVGNRQRVVDSNDAAVAIIQTVAVEIVRLADVGLEHARDEGEGFDSVAAWRRGHEAFWHSAEMRDFLNNSHFTVDDETLVVLERFQLVEALRQAAP